MMTLNIFYFQWIVAKNDDTYKRNSQSLTLQSCSSKIVLIFSVTPSLEEQSLSGASHQEYVDTRLRSSTKDRLSVVTFPQEVAWKNQNKTVVLIGQNLYSIY